MTTTFTPAITHATPTITYGGTTITINNRKFDSVCAEDDARHYLTSIGFHPADAQNLIDAAAHTYFTPWRERHNNPAAT